MLLVDLQELEAVLKISRLLSRSLFAVLRYKREDFHQPSNLSIREAITQTVQRETGCTPAGRIAVLANWRFLGFQINPMTTYYCWDVTNSFVEFVVAEVTNTPWKERHAYVLRAEPGQEKLQCCFNKTFYVSPFNPVAMEYRWLSTPPAERLMIHIENWQTEKVMDATLMLDRKTLDAKNLQSAAIRFPLITVKVVWLIYWQALKLWYKKVPYHQH